MRYVFNARIAFIIVSKESSFPIVNAQEYVCK